MSDDAHTRSTAEGDSSLLNRRKKAASSERLALDHERTISALIHIIATKLTAGSSRIFRRHFDLGTTEWRIMALVSMNPGVTPKAISQAIGFDKAAVSRSIKLLQKRRLALIRPDSQRSRFLHISLTESGQQMHDRIVRVALEREERFISCLSAAEVDLLVGLLTRLHQMVPHTNAPVTIDEPPSAAGRKAQGRPLGKPHSPDLSAHAERTAHGPVRLRGGGKAATLRRRDPDPEP